MPIYEYQCKECGGEFEYQQRMSDAPKADCESCGGQLERVISRSSFLLKGSGWYKDLYSSAKPQSAGNGAGATSSDASSGSKGDSGTSSSPSAAGSSSAPASSASGGSSD